MTERDNSTGSRGRSALHRPDEPHWFNIPNLLTFLRVALVPVILWLLTIDSQLAQWWAFGVFVVAALTDSIDGWVARRWQGVTAWGELADPVADKLLIVGAMLSLALVDTLAWWVVAVVTAREVAVTLMRVSLVKRRGLVLPASVWGKIKTVTQMIAVGAFLLPIFPLTPARRFMDVAVALTIWSGMDYAIKIRRQARDETSVADTSSKEAT
ncbi:MAG: CDP-diacylglycerol--glycerol-3-phosphate 3-phosphatidyltransferase [Nitriliruptoraceae bacterium]